MRRPALPALMLSMACQSNPVDSPEAILKHDDERKNFHVYEEPTPILNPCPESVQVGVPISPGNTSDSSVHLYAYGVEDTSNVCVVRVYSDRPSTKVNFSVEFQVENPFEARNAFNRTSSLQEYIDFISEKIVSNGNATIHVSAYWRDPGTLNDHIREVHRNNQYVSFKESLHCDLYGDQITAEYTRFLSDSDLFTLKTRYKPYAGSKTDLEHRALIADIPSAIPSGTRLEDWMDVSQAFLKCHPVGQ